MLNGRHSQMLRYICEECGALLMETETPVDSSLYSMNREECPKCGSPILNAVVSTKEESQTAQLQQVLPELRTAYDLDNKLTFDIKELDSLINLSIRDRACVIGSRKYTNILLTRLSVRALMAKRRAGLNSPNVIIIDAGNSLDFYLFVNFARQYGLDIQTILKKIIISRAFTVYQLADLIINELPHVLQQYNSKIVIIPSFLAMFGHDPQLDIKEAEFLVKEIMHSLKRKETMGDILVMVSWNYDNDSRYNKLLFPTFNKRIEIEVADKTNLYVKVKSKRNTKSFKVQEKNLMLADSL